MLTRRFPSTGVHPLEDGDDDVVEMRPRLRLRFDCSDIIVAEFRRGGRAEESTIFVDCGCILLRRADNRSMSD